jgi:hypothetical protein
MKPSPIEDVLRRRRCGRHTERPKPAILARATAPPSGGEIANDAHEPWAERRLVGRPASQGGYACVLHDVVSRARVADEVPCEPTKALGVVREGFGGVGRHAVP